MILLLALVALVSAQAECDGETTRTCAECVALTETFTHCNYCKSDKRCQGDLDISSVLACDGGYVGDVAGCNATPKPTPKPTPPPAPECDGETTRSCTECVALTELGTKCNYCKSDKRCQGDLDISSVLACAGGYTGDAAGCAATPKPAPAPTPAPLPECDGEKTRTCEECVALTELGTKCNFCKSDSRCQGDLDISTSFACSGGYTSDAAGCKATPAPTEAPSCDGETSRSCEECVGLTEKLTKCNYCKKDGRCQGDLDISSTFACEGGYVGDVAGCKATPGPTTAPSCDGEITTCAACTAKSEFFLGKCNWCPDTGACYGNTDLSNFIGTCKSGFKGDCTDVTTDPVFKYDCQACSGDCATGCSKIYSNGLAFCLRSELQVIAGACKTSASPDGCCITSGPTSAPAPMRPLRPTFLGLCPTYRAGCDNAATFCSSKASHLSCATASDRCGDFNTISADFDRLCPMIKCVCSPVPNSCLPDLSKVAVTCTAAGAVLEQTDNCAACADCDCEKRCCQKNCADKKSGFKFTTCAVNNGVTNSDCKCEGKLASASSMTIAMMTIVSAIVLIMF